MERIVPPAPTAVGASSRGVEPAWRVAMRTAIREPAELCRRLGLPAEFAERAREASRDFPLFVPQSFILRMKPKDPQDPLLLQVLPRAEELSSPPHFRHDPVGDELSSRRPGVLQKYRRRLLLITTGACAAHCRYCFRRHFPYGQVGAQPSLWREAVQCAARDTSLVEVILSGGDPLTIADDRLASLVQQLESVEHLRWLRVHTRLPVLIPQRVEDELLDWLRRTRLTVTIVIHANHAQELDNHVADAVDRLHEAGCLVLNQAVWLRDVNDTLAAQRDLCERLIEMRVVPYYLHQLDRVVGAAHFEADRERGRQVMEQLRRELPGYAVPRFVEEEAGADHKLVLA